MLADEMIRFENQASTGRIDSVDKGSDYENKAVWHCVMPHPWAGPSSSTMHLPESHHSSFSIRAVPSGNLYTSGPRENRFYGELPWGGQSCKYRQHISTRELCPGGVNP
jgi:hypothetical protein